MATVIRAADHNRNAAREAFNFDDLTGNAHKYLDKVRVEAAGIVTQAQQEAAAIRQRAQQEGQHAAVQSAEQLIRKQLGTVLPALRQAVQDIQHAKQAWLRHWEAAGVHVAAAIAARVIRGELTRQPEIPLTLVREALELAAGSSQVRVHLNPADHEVIAAQVQVLLKETSGLGAVEVLADPAVTRGGCRVETRFGSIDQQFETQLARIEEELAQ